MRELTADTKIKLSQIKRLITDKHSKDQIGTVRRWSDNKLHEKTSHGWKVVANSKEYKINEYREVKARKDLSPKITTQKQFNIFVDNLFNKNYKEAVSTIHLPQIDRKLLKQLGIKDNTQFIFKARYPHINPQRKANEGQALREEEYKAIPNAIKNAKEAYIDKENHNFFIIFEDLNDKSKINKIVFNKTIKGNYLVTIGKVNKQEGINKKKTLLVRGRS